MTQGFRPGATTLGAIALGAITAAVVVNTLQIETRQIDVILTEGTSMAAAVSPDHRWIAMDLVGVLWVLPIRGGEAKRISPDLVEARQPSWSPDGERIAFQGYDDGVWHIYVIARAGGMAKALTAGEFDDREPAWSHDGSRIAFSSDRGSGTTTVWEVDVESGNVRQLSKRDAWMPAWSPGDREVLVVSADRLNHDAQPVAETERRPGLWGISPRGDRLILVDEETIPAAAGLGPDGTAVAYVTTGGVLNISGQPSIRDEDVFPFRPQFLSRTELFYTADGFLKRRRIGNPPSPANVRTIPFTAKVTLERARYPIAHRALEPSGPQPLKGLVTPVVAPNGRAVAFVALGDLWVKPIDGPPRRVTNDPAVELDPAWSPDSTRIAFSSDRSGHMDLWIHDFRENRDAHVTGDAGAISGAAWSPDGNHLAYLLNRRELRAVTIQRDSHALMIPSLPRTRGEIGRPTWSPDNRTVAIGALFPYSDRYREGLNQVLIYSLDSGAETTSRLFPGHSVGDREDTGPVWAPEGFRMAFVSEGALWVAPVDERGITSAPPRAIATDQPESPSWEADSRHIVYQTPSGLRRVGSEGGVPEPIALDLTWSALAPPPRVVVHAGHVLDGVFDALRGESDIVIEGGIIREIEAHRDELHRGLIVDAPDEIAIPGLIDMHAHLDRDYGERFGRLWLAYGVTSVRLTAVNPYAGLELREAFDSGRRPGPRVFMAGNPFDGVRVYYPGALPVTSESAVDQELDRASQVGVDFFKTYVRLPDRLQKRVVDFAHAQGKPVTSHELFPAVALGVDGVEHLRGTSRRGYSPKLSARLRAYRDVVDLIAKSGMTLTPTIGIQGGFEARVTGDTALGRDQRLNLYPRPVVSRLADLAARARTPLLESRVQPLETILKAIVASGGRIIAGTDAPIDPYGLSLHVELEEYVRAGLTPFQALQTATVNAAQALGLESELGTIEVGKRADLILLGASPLDDIRNTRDVRRVVRGGRVFTVKELLRR